MAAQLVVPGEVAATVTESIDLRAQDAEALLVAWLSELLYVGERHGCVFTEFDMLEVGDARLRATVRGGPVGEYLGHIKAVTFSELHIARRDDGFETMVVFDA
jgi:SHS2 domain-containing protein